MKEYRIVYQDAAGNIYVCELKAGNLIQAEYLFLISHGTLYDIKSVTEKGADE